jgi:hypothetical protein
MIEYIKITKVQIFRGLMNASQIKWVKVVDSSCLHLSPTVQPWPCQAFLSFYHELQFSSHFNFPHRQYRVSWSSWHHFAHKTG